SSSFFRNPNQPSATSDPFDPGSDFGSHPHLDRTNRRHRTHNSPGGNHARRDRFDPDGCDFWKMSVPQNPPPPPAAGKISPFFLSFFLRVFVFVRPIGFSHISQFQFPIYFLDFCPFYGISFIYEKEP
ncbi:hypothetical protein PHJA_002941200, partial [Phtheirospermum japonicum]